MHILCIKKEKQFMQAKNGEIEQLKSEMSELKMMMTQVLEKCNERMLVIIDTLEVLRTSYNDLVDEVGGLGGLRTSKKVH